MSFKTILSALLVVVAIIMIYLGYKASMKPPILTGVGFIIIALLFNVKPKS